MLFLIAQMIQSSVAFSGLFLSTQITCDDEAKNFFGNVSHSPLIIRFVAAENFNCDSAAFTTF
jgi:hypothetical protein